VKRPDRKHVDAIALEKAASHVRRLTHEYYRDIGLIPTPRDIDTIIELVVRNLPKPADPTSRKP